MAQLYRRGDGNDGHHDKRPARVAAAEPTFNTIRNCAHRFDPVDPGGEVGQYDGRPSYFRRVAKKSCSRVFVFGLFIAFCAHVSAGKLEKAFEALNVKNYFLAREILLEQTTKHPAAAWYGLSVITGRADNPFYRIDTSFIFIQRSDSAFTLTTDKERSVIKELGVDGDAIAAQKEHIYSVAWSQAQAVNTVTAYDNFIHTFTRSSWTAQATLLRDHLAFLDARSTNTSAGYSTFLARYPDARDSHEARSHMEEAVFREAAPNGTAEEFERFIVDHPESPYVRDAADALYHLTAPQGTPGELHRFILKYPLNPNVSQAWRSIYAAPDGYGNMSRT